MLIIFDLDDTIIDTSGSIIPFRLKKALDVMIQDGLKVDDKLSAYQKMIELDQQAQNSNEALKSFLESIDQQKFYPSGHAVIYKDRDFSFPIQTTTNAKIILENLAHHYDLALVSYGERDIQLLKMEKAGIDTTLFSTIIICQEPDKSKSYRSLKDLTLPQDDKVIVVGDRIERDLLPAKELGFTTVLMKWGRGILQDEKNRVVDYTITSLEQLIAVLNDVKKNKENM